MASDAHMSGRHRLNRGLAGMAAAAAVLTGCTGTPDDGAATPTAPSQTEPAPSRTEPGATRDPAAPIPSAGFLSGIAEAWTVPGTAIAPSSGATSADRGMIAMWAQSVGGPLQVFELAPTASDPLWEGTCAAAAWWGDRLVCGGDIVDPRTGETTPAPAGTYAGSNTETLVLRDGDTWVAYGPDLGELWRAGVAGDGMVYGFPDLPVAMAVDMEAFDFTTADLRTGAMTPTAMTVLAADGYYEAENSAGPLVAYDLSGTEVAESDLAAPECVPPYGERRVLADRLSCPERYSGTVDANGLTGFLLRAEGSPKLLEFTDTGFAIDGEAFEAGERGFVMAWLFGDEDHFLTRFDTGFGLYAAGSPDPVWEADANDLLVASPDVLLAYRDDGAVAVLTP